MVSKAIELIATEPFCLTKPKFQNLVNKVGMTTLLEILSIRQKFKGEK